MIETGGKRGSRRSVMAERHDDDESYLDDLHQISENFILDRF